MAEQSVGHGAADRAALQWILYRPRPGQRGRSPTRYAKRHSMLARLFGQPDPPEVMQICSATKLSTRTARRILLRFDTGRYSEIATLLIAQSDRRLFHDPIEDLPEMATTLASASADADAELEGIERGMGFCHRLWRTKKRILKMKYGVDWLTPGEMNPTTRFD